MRLELRECSARKGDWLTLNRAVCLLRSRSAWMRPFSARRASAAAFRLHSSCCACSCAPASLCSHSRSSLAAASAASCWYYEHLKSLPILIRSKERDLTAKDDTADS